MGAGIACVVIRKSASQGTIYPSSYGCHESDLFLDHFCQDWRATVCSYRLTSRYAGKKALRTSFTGSPIAIQTARVLVALGRVLPTVQILVLTTAPSRDGLIGRVRLAVWQLSEASFALRRCLTVKLSGPRYGSLLASSRRMYYLYSTLFYHVSHLNPTSLRTTSNTLSAHRHGVSRARGKASCRRIT